MKALESQFYLLFPIFENSLFSLRWKAHKNVQKFRGFIREIMNQKKRALDSCDEQKLEDMDLLTLMIRASSTSGNSEELLSEEEMIVSIKFLFVPR